MLSEQLVGYQDWVSTLPESLQWVMIILFAAIPYIEIHGAVAIGVLSGINPVVSVLLSIIGNFSIVFIFTVFGDKLSNKFGKKNDELSPKRQKFNKNFEKYGVVGTSMLGWLILPSFIMAFLMSTVAKVEKSKIIFWMTISLVVWGTVAGVISTVLFA